jgi:hypothetical protein
MPSLTAHPLGVSPSLFAAVWLLKSGIDDNLSDNWMLDEFVMDITSTTRFWACH